MLTACTSDDYVSLLFYSVAPQAHTHFLSQNWQAPPLGYGNLSWDSSPWRQSRLGLSLQEQQHLTLQRRYRMLWGAMVCLILLAGTHYSGLWQQWQNMQKLQHSTEYPEYPGMIWDPAQQALDPHSIDTDTTYQYWLKPRANIVLVDARTPGEQRVGTIPKFQQATWPDIVQGKLGPTKNKKYVIACWTGMRGSEACARLREKRIDPFFSLQASSL